MVTKPRNDTEFPTVHLGGVTYKLPFVDLFRPHTPAERERLTTSITQHGVRTRVLTYTSATRGRRCVIDGGTRLQIAAEQQLAAVPVQDLGEMADEAAEELARTLNADRRHLTVEEQQAARQVRIPRVLAARTEGESLRTIAEREGVSEMQVRRDLAEGGATGVAPGRVRGADGKRYPTLPPVSVPPRPDRQLAQVRTTLTRFRSALDALLGGEWGEHLRRTLTRHRAEHVVETLDAALSDLAAEAAQGFDE